MAPKRDVFRDDITIDEEGSFDPEEDVMPADILTLRRAVVCPDGRTVCIDAHLVQHDESGGMTWMKMYEKGTPDAFNHCYIDTLDAELILNAVENHLRNGKGPDLAKFFSEEGRVIMNPVTFRMKMDAAISSGDKEGWQ